MRTQSVTMPISRRPEFAGILRDEEPFATSGRENLADELNGEFDGLVVQSGVEMAPSLLLWVCACSSAVAGLALFVLFENPLWTAIGVLAGGMLPICWVKGHQARRRACILRQAPEAISKLGRLLRAGRNLNESLHAVAADTPQPLGQEIRACMSRLQFNLPLADALGDLPRRTGIEELNQLVAAFAMHQRTGANPIPVLERLAAALRSRGMQDKQRRAAARFTRTTAVLLILAPWLLLATLAVLNPLLRELLVVSRWSWWVMSTAVLLQGAGIVSILYLRPRPATTA